MVGLQGSLYYPGIERHRLKTLIPFVNNFSLIIFGHLWLLTFSWNRFLLLLIRWDISRVGVVDRTGFLAKLYTMGNTGRRVGLFCHSGLINFAKLVRSFLAIKIGVLLFSLLKNKVSKIWNLGPKINDNCFVSCWDSTFYKREHSICGQKENDM